MVADNIIKQAVAKIIEEGIDRGNYHELEIPTFTADDGKIISCVETSCNLKDLDSPGRVPLVVFYATPGEDEATHRAHENNLAVKDFYKVITFILNADKNLRLKVSAEEKLKDLLKKYNVKEWRDNGEGVYWGISVKDEAIVARCDKEHLPNEESGIRVEIFPPYYDLRTDTEFIQHMREDIMETGDWARFGKFCNWAFNGGEEGRPSPIDMYFSDAADITTDMEIMYLEDEYESIGESEVPPLIHTDTKPYTDMMRLIKADVLELIETAVLENGAQVNPNLGIAYADAECGLECNHTDNTVGVAIQSNQDTEELELSFIHGTSFESPDYSADVPLGDFPVESLILIYNNLK